MLRYFLGACHSRVRLFLKSERNKCLTAVRSPFAEPSLMFEVADRAQISPLRLSFTGTPKAQFI